MEKFVLNVITPTEHFIKELEIKSLTVTTINGQITLLRNHINLISLLTLDTCTVTLTNGEKRLVNINYGILIVKAHEVKILTNSAKEVLQEKIY